MPVAPTVCYKTKPYKIWEDEKTFRLAINFKQELGRTDCNLKPHEHSYYNSDLFAGMLKRAAREAQQGRSWQYLDSLPDCITVDTSRFLAVVRIQLPASFIR
jgi:hypothetical protein